ncbi:MIF2 [Candida metapsilosis]|uniref:MIF2 n=1 Tax=Candida metapsilosis TaxID=273372 RepID=A0A8H7ZJ86_9ASCO|nr:MIF2 [Candida metapsilosis]
MELLQLGKRSRKLGLTIKKNLHRDEYGMDDMDEFFADDTQAEIMLKEQEDRVLRQGEVYKSPTSYNVASRKGRFDSFIGGGPRRSTITTTNSSSQYDIDQGVVDVPPYESGFGVGDVGNDYISEKEDQSPFNYVARKINFDNGDDVGDRSVSEQSQLAGTNKQSPLRSPLPEQRHNSAIGLSQGGNFLEDVDDYDFAQQDNNDFYQDEGQYPDEDQVIDPVLRQHDRYNSRSISPPPEHLEQPDPLPSTRETRSSRRLGQRNKRRNSFSESEDSTQASVSAFIENTKDTDQDDEDEAGSTTTELFVRSSSSTEPSQSRTQTQSQSQRRKRSNRSRASRNTRNVSPTYMTEVPTLPSPPPDGLRRSKRIRIKPLAFWRNERIVFTKPHQRRPGEEDDEEEEDDPDMTIVRDVHKLPLRSIAEVIHVPDTVQLLSTRHNRRNKRKPVDTPISPISSDEHDQEEGQNVMQSGIPGTSWYKDKVLKINVPDNGEFVERSIAYSSQYSEFKARKIHHEDGTTSEDPNLKVASLFNDILDDCGVGMMELSGVKPPLKIGSSNYYLLIVKGVVEITFNEETFIADKGCNVCIPSGNEYGLKNLGKEPALVHFVQVRKPVTEEDDDDEGEGESDS